MRNFVDYYIRYTEHVSDINDAAVNTPQELVEQTEKLFGKRLGEITEFIHTSGKRGNKIVLLAGPSCSGKTSTAGMLCDGLSLLGVNAVRISLDEFFLGAERTPLLPDGTVDYESVRALDIPVMQECLLKLVRDGECMMPHFDFTLERPAEKKQHIELGDNGVAIVEGIHALNPIVSQCLPEDSVAKIFVNVMHGIYEDDREVLTSRDIRLVRRIVRDMQFRNSPPERTLDMWPKVISGERQNILPYRSNANISVNSLHIYEPGVLKNLAVPMLQKVDESSAHYSTVQEILKKLELFEKISPSSVPTNSLMREFIGTGGVAICDET